MKKIILITLISCVLLASCRKDRICVCTDTGVAPVNPPKPPPKEYKKLSKKKAKSNCDDYEKQLSSPGNHVECRLE